jgi:cleavage and polyadenylation specificity factor subunit 1
MLTIVENLPYDSMYLLPCPSWAELLLQAMLSFILATAVSKGWTTRISDVLTLSADPTRELIFVDEKTFSLILKDGRVYPTNILVDRKTISNLFRAL